MIRVLYQLPCKVSLKMLLSWFILHLKYNLLLLMKLVIAKEVVVSFLEVGTVHVEVHRHTDVYFKMYIKTVQEQSVIAETD